MGLASEIKPVPYERKSKGSLDDAEEESKLLRSRITRIRDVQFSLLDYPI